MNRWAVALFAAFGLKGMYRETEEQRVMLAELRDVARTVTAAPTGAVISATDEAGSFHREK